MSIKQKARAYRTPAARTVVRKQTLPYWVWVGLGILIVALIASVFLFQTAGTPTATALPKEISVAQAAEKRAAGAYILDVREPYEWEEVHIPDANLIPLGELDGRLNELPRNQEIVVVCRSGNRSQMGRDILLNAGFAQVTSMAGGMTQWRDQGFPTATGP